MRAASCLRRSLLAFVLLAAGAAFAQHPPIRGPRPLHLRIAAADVVALGTIGAIDEDRIQVRDVDVLHGSAAAAFEIKRSPAQPPPFVTGVPAVLLLRGARSPYVLVDEPREVVLLRDEADARRWAAALESLLAATGDPTRLLHTYLLWLDGDDEPLREAAAAALSEPEAPFVPLGRSDAQDRARSALDPRRAPPARRVSAILAATHPEGLAALLAGVPGATADPQVVATALLAPGDVSRAARSAAVLRALGHEDRDVRRAALQAAPAYWTDAVAAKVAELAASDADPEARRAAVDARLRAEDR